MWCRNANNGAACVQSLDVAFRVLENARSIDECLHLVEFRVRRNDERVRHDAECHRQWD
jgi:hypothetical protein